MASNDPLDILLEHDLWATKQILQACSSLTSEQFHKRFEMGPGSLHDTVVHMLGAIRNWGDMLARRELRPRLESQGAKTTAELQLLLDEIASDFARTARAGPLDETITATRGGKSYTFPRGVVITHVATHGMHHRAQCLNMLRHLGVEKLPPSSVIEWFRAVSGQA